MTKVQASLSTYRFSLRFLFILVTLSGVACLVMRAAFSVPILGTVCVFYLPLFAMYTILRGPYLIHRWKTLREQYHAIQEERRSYLRGAASEHDKGNPDDDLPSNSASKS